MGGGLRRRRGAPSLLRGEASSSEVREKPGLGDVVDEILLAIGNPVRRRILEKISEQGLYPLQLSRELNVSQQAVMKHLEMLERVNLVRSMRQKSPLGPSRKCYATKTSLSLTIDMAESLFSVRTRRISLADTWEEAIQLRRRVERARGIGDVGRRMAVLSEIIGALEDRIEDVERRRISLAYVKNVAMKELASTVDAVDVDYTARRVLFSLLAGPERSVEEISRRSNLREAVVRSLISYLERRSILIPGTRLAELRGAGGGEIG